MGFFAVIRHPEGEGFLVEQCHLNFWALAGILGHRFLWDVGLLLRAPDSEDLNRLQVALPVGTAKSAFRDLSDILLDPKVLSLVFGREVEIRKGGTIDYGEGRVPVVSVPQAGCTYESEWSGRHHSLWTVQLDPPLAAKSQGYVRFRFKVASAGGLWTWKRSFLGRNGARFDLRVSDVREAWDVGEANALLRRILPIEKLFCFVIAPASLRPVNCHPQPQYFRLLEGRPWERYLERTTGLFRPRKLLICEWRGESISPHSRFQGFLDLNRDFPLQTVRVVLGLAVLGTLAAGAAVRLSPGIDFTELGEAVVSAAGASWKLLAGLGVLGLLPFIRRVRGYLFDALEAARRVEDWILAKLASP